MFLLHILIWAIPAYIVVAVFEADNGGTGNFFKDFAVAFGVLSAIIIFINICIYTSQSKRTEWLAKACYLIASNLKNDKEVIWITTERARKAEILLNNYLRQPDLTIEQIEMKRREFDSIYKSIDKDTKKENE